MKAFIAVAESLSFSTAAEKLHLTQPAMSKRISSLELGLDTRLFDRIGRRVQLTDSGRRLLPRARRIVQDLEDAENHVRGSDGSVDGRLKLATSHHIGLHRLPEVLRQYHRLYADVHLDIDFMDSEAAHHKVLQGEVELAVVTLAPIMDKQLQSSVVWPDRLVFVVAPEHPLLLNAPTTLESLSQHPAVLPGLNTFTGQIVQNLFHAHGLPLDTRLMSTNYLETIKMLVSIGIGWSVLPHSMLDEQIVELPCSANINPRQLGYIYHHKRQLSAAASAFIETLSSHAQETELP